MITEQLQFEIEKIPQSRLHGLEEDSLQFGKVFTDHMFVADFIDGQWTNMKITPYKDLVLSPATSFIHYGQSIFEGLKAHYGKDGDVFMFRPKANIARMKTSAIRMCMPPFPEDIFLDALKTLLSLDKAWMPKKDGSSMYIRPFMFGTDEFLGVKASDNYRFMIIMSPSGSYYKNPVKVKIETHFTRAASGGTGSAKAAGNYAGSMYPAKLAAEEGYQQLIWTDGKYHRNIEESGTMNLMMVIDDVLVTPKLSNTILEGVTRNSILNIARDWGWKVEERTVSVEEVVDALENGKLNEAFGVGTAATIAQISTIGYEGKDYELPAVADREFSNKISTYLEDYKRGRVEDKFNYLVKID